MTSAIPVQRSNQLSYLSAVLYPQFIYMIIISYIDIHFSIYGINTNSQLTRPPSWLDSSVGYSAAPVSQRSWVQFPFKPEFFQVSFHLLKLKHLHCDDLHIILSLSAVHIYDYYFIY